MPENCGQCVLLIAVGFGLNLLQLIIVNTTYFLLKIKKTNQLFTILLRFFACFTPTIYLLFELFKVLKPNDSYNTDFEMFYPSVIVAFILGTWTFYKFSKKYTAKIV